MFQGLAFIRANANTEPNISQLWGTPSTLCERHSCDVIISLSFFLAADYGVQFLYVLFWGGAVMMTLYVVLYFGNEYVDQPRLVQVQAKDKNV